MLGKSHVRIAIGMSIATLNINFILGSAIGCLLPDIDTKKSIAGKYNIFNRLTIFKKYVKHRGVTHSWRGVFIFLVPVVLIFNKASALGLIYGYILHLLSDLPTYRGIQLMWPDKKRYRIASIKTGSFTEKFISTLIFLIGILILLRSLANV